MVSDYICDFMGNGMTNIYDDVCRMMVYDGIWD